MKAALVEGVKFVKDKNGYWTPNDNSNDRRCAHNILAALALKLGYRGREEYLYALRNRKDEVKERLLALSISLGDSE